MILNVYSPWVRYFCCLGPFIFDHFLLTFCFWCASIHSSRYYSRFKHLQETMRPSCLPFCTTDFWCSSKSQRKYTQRLHWILRTNTRFVSQANGIPKKAAIILIVTISMNYFAPFHFRARSYPKWWSKQLMLLFDGTSKKCAPITRRMYMTKIINQIDCLVIVFIGWRCVALSNWFRCVCASASEKRKRDDNFSLFVYFYVCRVIRFHTFSQPRHISS